jgi:hypothetical protein
LLAWFSSLVLLGRLPPIMRRTGIKINDAVKTDG